MTSTNPIQGLSAKVQELVSPKRFAHILRVVELTQAIAIANGINPQTAALAALLHDVARDLPLQRLFELAPPRFPQEEGHPEALHGRAGRVLAQSWGIQDPQVLEAIEGHVCGVLPTNPVGMALFVADGTEPARNINGDIRELALAGHLAQAYAQAFASKLRYLQSKNIPVHPHTCQIAESLRQEGWLLS